MHSEKIPSQCQNFLGRRGKSWSSFNYFHVVLTCLGSKETFLCELGGFKASFAFMHDIDLDSLEGLLTSLHTLLDYSSRFNSPPFPDRKREVQRDSSLRWQNHSMGDCRTTCHVPTQGYVSSSTHHSIPSSQKGLRSLWSKGLWIFFFSASELMPSHWRQPLAALALQEAGPATRNPSS